MTRLARLCPRALADRLVEHRCRSGREVRASSTWPRIGRPISAVAALAGQVAQPLLFAADADHHRAGEIDAPRVPRRRPPGRRSSSPPASAARGAWAELPMRSTASHSEAPGRGLHRRRRERRRAAVAHQHAADSGALADPEQRAEIARILDVLDQDHEARVAARSPSRFASPRRATSAAKPLWTAPPSQIGSRSGASRRRARRPAAAELLDLSRRPPRLAAATIQTRRTSAARLRSASCTGWKPKIRCRSTALRRPPSSSTTANAAIPSPRPIAPSPSFVVALSPTALALDAEDAGDAARGSRSR